MTLDPRLLRSFVVLAEELHFGRAAARLHIAQPALSQQVKRLETQLGVALFARTRRAVELTEAGIATLAPARAAVEAAALAEATARGHAADERGELRLGISPGVHYLAQAMLSGSPSSGPRSGCARGRTAPGRSPRRSRTASSSWRSAAARGTRRA